MRKYFAILMLIAFLSMHILGCAPAEPYQKTVFIMDTSLDIAVYGTNKKQAAALTEKIIARMQQLENVLSGHIPGSDVSRINEAAGNSPVKVEPETLFVVRRALEIAEMSDGAFDPTIGPLLDLWGWGAGEPRVPAADEINAVLPLVNYKAVKIDADKATIFLTKPGMKLDLGGIAKGFIADQGREAAKGSSFAGLFINAGGDISIAGSKPSGEKWRVAVQSPADPAHWAAVLEIAEGCPATSGDYQRYFTEDGQVYHHILDPKTGLPGKGASSVTTVAPDALSADALSTAVFVLGADQGMRLLESLDGVEGVIIDKQGEMFVSPGLENNITVVKP